VTANGERTERKIMVTYDHWSYLTIISPDRWRGVGHSEWGNTNWRCHYL